MRALAACGGGFLLAVLWFDLMFDIQARRPSEGDVAPQAVASISAYYARVTTQARPMNRLVAVAMLTNLGSLVVIIANEEVARWRGVAALVCVASAIGLAGARTVKTAVRLGGNHDELHVQSSLAQQVLRDHTFCLAAVLSGIVLVLMPA